MSIQATEIAGVVLVKQPIHKDARGYVIEMYKRNEFERNVQSVNFVQDYELHVAKNVIRGLHYQQSHHSQSILVRCVSGSIISLALDLRIGSNTYGKCLQTELNEDNKFSEFIPQGFAHGFIALKDNTIIQYKSENYYNEDITCGVNVFDSALTIEFPCSKEDAIVSEIDLKWPSLKDVKSPFIAQ